MNNKILLKVSYILGLICGIIETITLVGAILGIPTIIISLYIRKIYLMSNAEIEKNKETLFYVSLVYALVSPISGIMSIIFYILLERKNLEKINKTYTNK